MSTRKFNNGYKTYLLNNVVYWDTWTYKDVTRQVGDKTFGSFKDKWTSTWKKKGNTTGSPSQLPVTSLFVVPLLLVRDVYLLSLTRGRSAEDEDWDHTPKFSKDF